MARSRSYQRSRHGFDRNRRPLQSVTGVLTTFEGAGGNLIEDLEADPVFSGKRLSFYVSSRDIRELHKDPRLGCGNDSWMLERTLAYNSQAEPRYAFA